MSDTSRTVPFNELGSNFFLTPLNLMVFLSRVLCTEKCNTRYSPKISAIGNCMINSVVRVYDTTDRTGSLLLSFT